MQDDTAFKAELEQAFPDGIAGSGFSYSYSTDGVPGGRVMLEIRMPTETMRLFFERHHFKQFASETHAVARELE